MTAVEWLESRGWDYMVCPISAVGDFGYPYCVVTAWKGTNAVVVCDVYGEAWRVVIQEVVEMEERTR